MRTHLLLTSVLALLILLFLALQLGLLVSFGTEAYGLTSLLPLVLVVGFALLFSWRHYVLLLVFAIPLAFQYKLPGLGTTIITPSEPMTGLLALLMVAGLVLGRAYPRSFIRHPITLFVGLHLLALLISCVFSTMPFVSVKSLVVRTTYLLVFYVLIYELSRRSPGFVHQFFMSYTLGMLVVIAFVWSEHAPMGFSKDISGDVTQPFFADHTIYGTCLSVLLPYFLVMAWDKTRTVRWLHALTAGVLLLAVIFSASRAAWLSLFVGLLCLGVLRLRIRFSAIMGVLGLCAVLVISTQSSWVAWLEMNRSNSNARRASAMDQLKSISNIRSDYSNLERINRWSCALRMFYDRPLRGFGFGTYQFQYIPYQRQYEMTPISVTDPWSHHIKNGGNAHSEYLNLLAEAGALGMLSLLGVSLWGLAVGFRLYYRQDLPPELRSLALALVLSLSVYITNGLVNSFLDTDKAAILFWGTLGLLVALDLKVRGGET